MKYFAAFILAFSFSLVPAALAAEKPAPPAKETTAADTLPDTSSKQIEAGIEKTSENINKSYQDRELSKAAVNILYGPLDLLIPNKFGVSANYFRTPNEVWELEYMRGKIAAPFFIDDIGAMVDERLSIGKRIFSGNSFNFSCGLTYFRFKAHIGSDLLNRATGGNTSNIDLLELEGVGFRLGVGNRWALGKNLTVGVDWIEWNQPLIITKEEEGFTDATTNQDDKEDVEDVMKWASYFPRLNILKLNLGYSFK